MEYIEKKIRIEDIKLLNELNYNTILMQFIENRFSAAIAFRGDTIIVRGNPIELKIIEKLFKEIDYIFHKTGKLYINDIETILDLIEPIDNGRKNDKENIDVIYYSSKEVIRAKTPKQKEYYEKVLNNDLVFSIGPAGTGKTFLAVAMALAALKRNEVSKIIISRPAVEAGESLGFLPGDFKEKLDPYLRPITDALIHMLGAEKMKSLMEKNLIEITPLAYMRGRTLSNAFIILDEAQNATITQMKMFLTRLGFESKAIVTGDITQVDLKNKTDSGLIHVQSILKNIKGIEFVYFTEKDVIRHRLVSEIIKAYDKDSKKRTKASNKE